MRGDEKAFKKLYLVYYKELCAHARKYFADKEDAEEVVQDTLVKIWEQREKLSNVQSLRHYLYTSVRNQCVNRLEHLKVVRKHSECAATELKMIELQMDDSFELVKEIETKVKQAMDTLPEQCGKIFKMKYVDGMKAKDIADATSLSQRTVETHIFNGLKHMRDKLSSVFTTLLITLASPPAFSYVFQTLLLS